MMEYIQWFVSATTDFVTEEAKQGRPQDLLPNIKKALSERVSCVLFTLRVFPAVGNIMLPGKAAKFSVSEVKGYQDESVEEVLKVSHTSTVLIYPTWSNALPQDTSIHLQHAHQEEKKT
jgi:hypothetical protein